MQPSGELLLEGAAFCESIARLGATSTFIPKGVYGFATHEDAEAHRIACLARGLAARAAARRGRRA